MPSAESIRQELTQLQDQKLKRLDPNKLSQLLSYWEDQFHLTLTLYGLLHWTLGKHGVKGLYENLLTSPSSAKGYAEQARNYRDDAPQALVNASNFLARLGERIPDIGIIVEKLAQMSQPYIIYVLFAGSGMQSLVQCYRQEYEEHMHRYPSTLDLLPDRYKLNKEVTDDTAAR